jgi:hypothetical protein
MANSRSTSEIGQMSRFEFPGKSGNRKAATKAQPDVAAPSTIYTVVSTSVKVA